MFCFQNPLLELESLVKKWSWYVLIKLRKTFLPNYILALLSRNHAPVLKSPSMLRGPLL